MYLLCKKNCAFKIEMGCHTHSSDSHHAVNNGDFAHLFQDGIRVKISSEIKPP